MTATALTPALSGIRSVELEITGTCDSKCLHCCTNSSPQTPAGSMTRERWQQVITDIAELDIPMVQFIGGEPTLEPYLPQYIDQALDAGLGVEVYSNLTHIRPSLWKAFSRKGVQLATSYYSDDAAQHDEITQTRGGLPRIRTNITEAVRRGIPLRAGVVEVIAGQRIQQAEAELRGFGVQHIRTDRARGVGRAAERTGAEPTVDELCGHCYRHRVSINPDGEVAGCILSRFMPTGNVRTQRLTDILHSARWAENAATIPEPRAGGCPPDDSDDCNPANTIACPPAYIAPAPAPSLETHA